MLNPFRRWTHEVKRVTDMVYKTVRVYSHSIISKLVADLVNQIFDNLFDH